MDEQTWRRLSARDPVGLSSFASLARNAHESYGLLSEMDPRSLKSSMFKFCFAWR